MRPNLPHLRTLSQDHSQRSGLKGFNLKFALWTEIKLGNLTV